MEQMPRVAESVVGRICSAELDRARLHKPEIIERIVHGDVGRGRDDNEALVVRMPSEFDLNWHFHLHQVFDKNFFQPF